MADRAVFAGVVRDPADPRQQATSLSIEPAIGTAPGETGKPEPLVRVDTSGGPDRRGEHPVTLSVENALDAATALIRTATSSYELTLDDAGARAAATRLLWKLQQVDATVAAARTMLLPDLWPLDTDD